MRPAAASRCAPPRLSGLRTLPLLFSPRTSQRDLLQRRDGFASSRAWQPAVRVAVDLLPSFADSFSGDVAGDVVAGEDCAVCGRSGHPAICTVRLSGPLCDAAGMMAPPREAAAGWWTDQVPLGDHALYAAHFAAGRQW